MAVAALVPLAFTIPAARANAPLARVIHEVQPKIVKIYGAGGFRGLEPYQSGFLISAEGHILTAHSYVLDADYITCTLDDGQKFEARLLGADPRLEIAVLKIEAKDMPHFDLTKAATANEGTRVLAFSNLFGIAFGEEAASVQHGLVTTTAPLEARRGAFETLYSGPVYVVDAMTNNPGAAGGALTNVRGEILGMLGKELRNARNNVWLNYAIPIPELTESVQRIIEGKSPPVPHDQPQEKLPNAVTLDALGIVLLPNVLDRTPAFIDQVRPNSPAAQQGIRADDLIMFINEQLVQSCGAVLSALDRIPNDEPVRMTILRGENELITVELEVTELPPTNPAQKAE